MTLRHLKIFVAVCESGSATAAGEKLYIAQPSVSLAIAELESYYGIRLFDRMGKRLHITEAGKRFLQYATHILGLFDEMETEIKNYDAAGVLRVGASITIGNYLLPSYCLAFRKSHPHMQVQVRIDNSDTVEQQVLANKLDLGLIEGLAHSVYITAQTFREDELVMLCAPGHPFAGRQGIDPAALRGEALLLREPGSAGRELFDSAMLTHGLEVAPLWESISTQALVRAVGAGLGVSVLPYLLVKDALDRGEISRFTLRGIAFRRDFSVIHHKDKFLTDSAKAFIALCR